MRVISLAPTHTESLAALGALDVLMGVTEDCDFPEDVLRLKTYGSWASPDLKAVREESPDLVCTFGRHQEEIAQWLRDQGISVFHSEPATIDESLESIRLVAQRLSRPNAGERLVSRLEARLQAVDRHRARIPEGRRPKIFRIMQWNPLITVGPGAFQYDVIHRAGGVNLFSHGDPPYGAVPHEEAAAWNPDIVFFCEPTIKPLLFEDPRWKHCSAVRTGRVYELPCGLTCRAGPRIVDMTENLARIVVNWVSEMEGTSRP